MLWKQDVSGDGGHEMARPNVICDWLVMAPLYVIGW